MKVKLFLSKTRVNTTFKKNSLPLFNQSNRNKNHNDTYVEQPILIDPSEEDPRDFIHFSNDEPYGLNDRGRYNIIFLGLRDDIDIVEDRMTYLAELITLKDIVDLCLSRGMDKSLPQIANSINLLKFAMTPKAKYSSMAIDLLTGWAPLK